MGFSRGFLGPLERMVPAEGPQWLPFRGGLLKTAEVPMWVMGHDMWGGTWEGFPRVSVSLEGKRGPLTEPWAGSMLCWEQGVSLLTLPPRARGPHCPDGGTRCHFPLFHEPRQRVLLA